MYHFQVCSQESNFFLGTSEGVMKICYLLLILLLSAVFVNAQNTQQQFKSDDGNKAEQIIQKAIEKLGGNRYLNVRTAVSKGLYTQYKGGLLQATSSFVDYIVYPDKERTEFKARGIRSIQTNVGNTGWVFDGGARTVKEMGAEQVKDFRDYTLRTSVETLLRGVWKKDNAKLEYVGRREATLGRRNEVVRVTYPDGFTVEFEFAFDGFPAKVIYKRKVQADEDDEGNKTDEFVELKEEVRLAQFIDIDGIFTPFVIDTYSDGKQTARVNFESVEFNKEIPENLFAKPTNLKDIK
jgi:hypothetical protein